MKIRLLPHKETKKEVLDQLQKGLKKIFPIDLPIKISSQRYEYRPEDIQISVQGNKIYNLAPIIEEYASNKKGEYLIIIIHDCYVLENDKNEYSGLLNIVGQLGSRRFYESLYRPNEQSIVLGLSNFPDENNLKVAGHEIGHIPTNKIDGYELLRHKRDMVPGHCKNYIDGKECLMSASTSCTEEELKKTSLKFCNTCIEKIIEGSEKLRKIK